MDGRAGLFDTSFRRTIIVSGSERREFLHGQLSQSLVTLKPGDGAPALLLNAQGRVISIVAIYDEGEAFEIAVQADNLDATLAPSEAITQARSRWPGVRLAALSCWWSERDVLAREVADVVLHKPVRSSELRALFVQQPAVAITNGAA